MKIDNSGNRLHSINFRKHAKPAVLSLIAIFIISILSVFASTAVHAATTPALHTQGNQILNADNNPVVLRGIGLYTGAPGAPDWIFWNSNSNPNIDSWSDQWNFSENPTMEQNAITSTMQAWEQTWHVNMIRVFIFPGLFPTITPAQADSNSGDNTQYNILTSLQGLCTVAAQYGIYVDICPAGITSYGNGDWTTWTNSQWTTFWTTMANGLKSYPNAIFEAWNEPSDSGNGAGTVASSYISYVQTTYNAIRNAGATNLLFVQWEPGWVPDYSSLAWASQLNSALGGNPTNVAYTTHLYYYSPSDDTPFWDQNGVDAGSGGTPMTTAQIQSALQGAETSMGVTAPLVINEFGDCLSASACGPSYSQDYSWFNSVCQATNNLGIGLTAYYWATIGNIAPDQEGLLSAASTYTPNTEGQDFINAYTAPTPTPTPTSTPTPTPTTTPKPTASPTPTPTAKPTPTPSPTPTPTAKPTPTPSPTKDPNPTPTPAPTQIPKPTPTPTPVPTTTPTPIQHSSHHHSQKNSGYIFSRGLNMLFNLLRQKSKSFLLFF
jgi:hypothetical protein